MQLGRNVLKSNLPSPFKQWLELLVQIALIPFEAQNLLPAHGHNLLGNLLLGAERVDRDDATVPV